MDSITKIPLYTVIPQEEPIRLLQKIGRRERCIIEGASIRTVSPPVFYGASLMPPQGSSVIVSAEVGTYLAREHPQHCKEIFAPDLSPAGCVRDASGRLQGITQLIRYQ